MKNGAIVRNVLTHNIITEVTIGNPLSKGSSPFCNGSKPMNVAVDCCRSDSSSSGTPMSSSPSSAAPIAVDGVSTSESLSLMAKLGDGQNTLRYFLLEFLLLGPLCSSIRIGGGRSVARYCSWFRTCTPCTFPKDNPVVVELCLTTKAVCAPLLVHSTPYGPLATNTAARDDTALIVR